MNVEVITRAADLAPLEAEWNALPGARASPLQRHDWFMAAAEAFAPEAELAVLTLREAGALRAVAPLVAEQAGPTRQLLPLGHQSFEPYTFLAADAAARAALFCALRRLGRPLSLLRFQAADEDAAELARAGSADGFQVVRPGTTASSFAPLGKSWGEIQAQIGSSARTYVRRKAKAAEKFGPVTFEVVAPTSADVDDSLDVVFRVESAGWKGRSGTSILADAAMERFCRLYGRRAAAAGILRVFVMRIGGEPAAVRMAMEYANRLWELKIGYDERFAKASPGIVLTNETLRWACERGLDAHEFLGLAEGWQKWWPNEVRPYATIRFYPARPAGAVAFAADALDFARRRVGAWREARRAALAPERDASAQEAAA